MKTAILGVVIGLIICLVVSPYFALWNLKYLSGIENALREIRDELKISAVPAADVRPVVRGTWESKDLDNFRKYEVVCSECKARYIGNYDAYDEPMISISAPIAARI